MNDQIYTSRKSCAICGNNSLQGVMHFGNVPLAGDFPTKKDLGNENKYELSLQFCNNCKLLQTDSVIDEDTLFRDYRYMSSIGLSGHFAQVAKIFCERFNLTSNSSVVEIGSNDGVLQIPLKELGIRCVGFEPSINISRIAKHKGCEVINDYFNEDNARKYIGKNTVDLIISNNCFAHIDDIHSIVKGVKFSLKQEGCFVIEVHYVKNLIEQLQYDNIYHEHIYYYSLNSLLNLFGQYGMAIYDYDEIPIHSGSIRVYIKNKVSPVPQKVLLKLEEEVRAGLCDLEYFRAFAQKAEEHMAKLKRCLMELKIDGAKIVGYGASGRANMLCNLCDIGPEIIDYIVDESPERCNRYIAGMHIPILAKEHLLTDNPKPNYVFVFAWNYSKMIMEKLAFYDFQYIIPFPKIQIVNEYSELGKFESI